MLDGLQEAEAGLPFPHISQISKKGEGKRSHVGHGMWAVENLTVVMEEGGWGHRWFR